MIYGAAGPVLEVCQAGTCGRCVRAAAVTRSSQGLASKPFEGTSAPRGSRHRRLDRSRGHPCTAADLFGPFEPGRRFEALEDLARLLEEGCSLGLASLLG